MLAKEVISGISAVLISKQRELQVPDAKIAERERALWNMAEMERRIENRESISDIKQMAQRHGDAGTPEPQPPMVGRPDRTYPLPKEKPIEIGGKP